jgi:hypothetical protein
MKHDEQELDADTCGISLRKAGPAERAGTDEARKPGRSRPGIEMERSIAKV